MATQRYLLGSMLGILLMATAPGQTQENGGAFDTREAFDALMLKQARSCLDGADDGNYAWSESYVMMGLVTMYQATGDTAYLDRFIEHADVVLSKRDSVLGRLDYQGRALPGWSAGEHYSIGEIRLLDAAGRPALYLRSSMTGYNNETKVTVTAGATPNHFTLHVLNERTNREDRFENLSMDPTSGDYAVLRIHASKLAQPFGYMRLKVKDLLLAAGRSPSVPAPVATLMAPSRMLWPVHQGMILEPMTRFARLVREADALRRIPRYASKAKTYQSAAEEIFRLLDADWHTNDRGEGWYTVPKGAPIWMDGCDEPHNHYLAVGCAMIHLAAISANPAWRDHVTRMARTLRNDMRHQPETDAVIWPYWWSKGKVFNGWEPEDNVSRNTPGKHPTRSMVDFSHASIDVNFACHCFQEGIIFTREDMLRLCNTFTRNIVRRTDDGALTFAARVDGKGAQGTYDMLGPNWVLLSTFRPDILDRFREIRKDSPWNGYALWMLQSANMNLMRKQLAD